MSTRRSIDISIFLINYNGAPFLAACLDSILESETTANLELILIDNASQDDSVSVIKPYKQSLVFVQNEENVGFSRANNQAEKLANGQFVFLLNTDTVLKKNTIELLYQYCRTHDVGAVTPKLLNADGSLQCPGSVFGQWRFRQDKVREVPFIAGAAVMMKRSVYQEMDGLDENLFFYNDDIDMCKSLKRLGYPIIYFPKASLIHYGGLSSKTRQIGSLIEGYRGGFYICRKYYGPIVYQLYRVLIVVDILIRLFFHVCCFYSKAHRAYVKAYLEILRIDLMNDILPEKTGKKESVCS